MTDVTPAKPDPRQLWLVPAEGQTSHQLVADVAVKARTYRLGTFTVPPPLAGVVAPGALVRVPASRGRRTLDGLCVRCSTQPWDQTRRPILEATAGVPWLNDRLVDLGLWVGEYYVCPPWKTFTALLPAAARKVRLKRVTYVRSTGAVLPRTPSPNQVAVLNVLGETPMRRDELLARSGVSPAVLHTLRKRGIVEYVVQREAITPRADIGDRRAATALDPGPCDSVEDAFDLTPGQRAAAHRIATTLAADDPFRVFLLFGVPGSGKTEVYVRVIRAAIAAGRQAILLIPEIALATQLVDRLARRFQRVAIVHSQLSERVRRETLAAVAAGTMDVVIGTRTAVFAPCPRLGLIVVDEEQEGSFKNLTAPYYHARDVAIKRGQLEHVPVVLGSATPALETWHNATHRPHYELLRLPERVPGARLPDVRCVRQEEPGAERGRALLSGALRTELAATLAERQQAILLHNRRGYAVWLRCERCGLVVSCQRCGSHLVYHRAENQLKCHRCSARSPVPAHCLDDTCQGRLVPAGLAIQRLEADLQRAFPEARLLRLDSDTMRHRDDYRAALQRFEAGAADVLLGTQMVAKGLDFPAVRLVGVIDADAALRLPDFRAGERVFQLIVQVVGRAGRRSGSSLALVQTAEAPAPVIRQALQMDYEAFAAVELAARRRGFYPPFARLARIVCADERPGRARDGAQRVSDDLRTRAERINARLRVDGPTPCVIARLRAMQRFEVIVRGPRDQAVQTLLHEAAAANALRPSVQRCTVDVDALDLF